MNCIAIDGPAGAGKSTIAKLVAKSLKFIYVDTGALYRALAFFLIEAGVDLDNVDAIKDKLNDILINLKYVDGMQIVIVNGEDVSQKIRQESVGNAASKISAYPIVREKLLDIQRDLGIAGKVVMDGRDIGTVVLPDAMLKIFLTASVETRADRRYKELISKGESPDIEKIKEDIIIRDKQDSERKIAPLKQAEDAVYLDTSDMNIDEVCDFIVKAYKGKVQ